MDPSRVLFLRYEQVLRDPADTIRKLAQFVGLPFTSAEEKANIVTEIVELCRLEKSKEPKGQQGRRPRKGVAGDWMSHMTSEMGERLDAIL
ncbi:hypothetical protein E2562_038167 [Oryza meyeriana var. granulata]|uniref:Sulfotransferase n=1 Tax=Oryza meyeriana var. granulata TaxID=110450 RepID=A0A6G1CNF3_9ORYZ|nr:hypothetical protein E2562_038167 [Oryza meyeriana var. granulata]